MIRYISGKSLVLSATVLFASVALANNTSNRSIEIDTNTYSAATNTYTAHGTMNKKTAMMIKYLLKNPHLSVEAYAGKKASKSNATLSYTIRGKTDRKTALRLKWLFENSKHISVSTTVSYQPPMNNYASYPQPSYQTQYPEYTPFYYKGVPPIYAKGNMLWYPIKIEDRQFANKSNLQKPIIKNYERTLVSR